MGAYGNIEKALAGLVKGFDTKVESWLAKAGIDFGYPIFGYKGSEREAYGYLKDAGKLVFDADFVTSNVITITVNGTDTADVTFDTDHDTTVDAVLAAIRALDGVEAALDADDTDNRTFYIRTKGETVTIAEAITGGSSQATGTITYGSSQVYVGVAQRTEREPDSTGAYYESGDMVNALVEGAVYVECSEAVNANETPYIDTATGKFGNADEAVTGHYIENATETGLVLVEVDGQAKMTYADEAWA